MNKSILIILIMLTFSLFSVFSLENYPNNQITVYTVTHSISEGNKVVPLNTENIIQKESVSVNEMKRYNIVYKLGKYLEQKPTQTERCRTIILRKGSHDKDISDGRYYGRDCNPPIPYHEMHSEQYIIHENLGLPLFNPRR